MVMADPIIHVAALACMQSESIDPLVGVSPCEQIAGVVREESGTSDEPTHDRVSPSTNPVTR